LLERVGEAILPATGLFTTAEKFRIGETIDGIKVGWLGGNFKKHFLPKVEKDEVAAETLTISKLLKGSKDPAIITALGGEEKVESKLAQFWEFLKTANRNLWYVGYIRDNQNTLWAVNALWNSDRLSVEAGSLGYPDDWHADTRFLSR
jgi:hypothetical protein